MLSLVTVLNDAGLNVIGYRRAEDGTAELLWRGTPTTAETTRAASIVAGFLAVNLNDRAAVATFLHERRLANDQDSVDTLSPTPNALRALALESGKGGNDAAIKARAKARLAAERGPVPLPVTPAHV